MWVATTFGWLSAVKRSTQSITDYGSPDKTLQIRARDRAALVELRRFMSNETSRIIVSRGSDYEFRVYCAPDKFALALARMAFEIDYTNFKNAVETDDLHNVYMRVWSVVANHYDKMIGRKRK